MSSIILNGKEYNDGISDIVEITQSAYNALPATKYTNNVLYCISDSVDGVDAYPPLIYSDEEREVGVWMDGKPLYQKTITFDCSNTSNVQTAYSIPTTHFIVAVLDAYFENSNNNLSQQFRYTWYKDHFWSYIVNNSGHAISVHRETTDGNWQSGVKFVATIQYTKTTDTAGSGKWNGQGGIACHYSTNETVVGTWIGGKPLYEKTVNIPSLPNATQSTYAHGIVNYKEFVSVTGYAKNSTGTNFPLPFANAANANYAITLFIDNANIKINTGTSNRSSYSGYVTLRYTKTTD